MSRPKLRGLHYRYEKAGLSVAGEPIPWNAEAVLVEASVRLPPGITPRKSDFQLRTPDRVPRMPVSLQSEPGETTVRVCFRLPPLQGQTLAVLSYQGSILGQVLLPYLTADAFLREVHLRAPTVFALLGKFSVACQTLVEEQCCGLSAGAVLTSPTSLLPLVDTELQLDVADPTTQRTQRLTITLTGSQLLAKEVALSVVLPPCPRRAGRCTVHWLLAERHLASAEVAIISALAFQQSLAVVEGRFLSRGKEGPPLYRRHLPARNEVKELRPCFLLASRAPGMAGLCSVEVRVYFRDASRRPLTCDEEILVTDRPLVYVPDLPVVADFQQVRAFELLCQGQVLGTLPVRPTPAAAFTSEGGFRAAAEIDWTPFTEEELLDRLERLMESHPAETARSPVPFAEGSPRDFAVAARESL